MKSFSAGKDIKLKCWTTNSAFFTRQIIHPSARKREWYAGPILCGEKGPLSTFSFKECEEPPNTAQEVLMVVQSENRSPIFDGRVCEDLWNPVKNGVWNRESQCCKLQALSNTVTIHS